MRKEAYQLFRDPSSIAIGLFMPAMLILLFGYALSLDVKNVPVAVVLLVITGLVPIEKLAAARGYVVIGIFVIAAILTPPDALSQTMMALPMWLLYEAGLIFARIMLRMRAGQPRDGEETRSG